MLRRLILFIILTLPSLTFADAFFKFTDNVVIKVINDKGQSPTIDSICVINLGWETEIATLHYDTDQFHNHSTLHRQGSEYRLRSPGKQFIVVVFVNSKKIQSTILTRHLGNDYYVLKINDNALIDISPLFHSTWFSYFIALFVTLLTEVLIGLSFFYKNKNGRLLETYLLGFILTNVLTHFSLWYVYTNGETPMFILEFIVVFIESIFWLLFLKVDYLKAVLFSLLTNFASWALGGVISLFV